MQQKKKEKGRFSVEMVDMNMSDVCERAVCVLQWSPAAASASSVGNGVEPGAQLLLLG